MTRTRMAILQRTKCLHCLKRSWWVQQLDQRDRRWHTHTQFIFRFEIGDAYLGAVSRFMSNAFEYGDALLPQPEKPDTEDPSLSPIESNQPYLNLATYVSLANHTIDLTNILVSVSVWLFWPTKFWSHFLKPTFLSLLNWAPARIWSRRRHTQAYWVIFGLR